METKELMIGDWVYNAHHKKNIRITAYDFFLHGHFKDGAQYIYGTGLLAFGRDLSPIPLTPEILEKNGFKKEGSWFIIEDDYYDVSIKEITDSIWRVKYCNTEFSAFDCVLHIAFVHELQHALRLCGIEKEIIV